MSTKTVHFIISDGLVFISDLGHLKFFFFILFLESAIRQSHSSESDIHLQSYTCV